MNISRCCHDAGAGNLKPKKTYDQSGGFRGHLKAEGVNERGVRSDKQSVGSAGEVLASGNAPPRIVFPVIGETIRGENKFTL